MVRLHTCSIAYVRVWPLPGGLRALAIRSLTECATGRVECCQAKVMSSRDASGLYPLPPAVGPLYDAYDGLMGRWKVYRLGPSFFSKLLVLRWVSARCGRCAAVDPRPQRGAGAAAGGRTGQKV